VVAHQSQDTGRTRADLHDLLGLSKNLFRSVWSIKRSALLSTSKHDMVEAPEVSKRSVSGSLVEHSRG
jgi:hypothetical protein